MAAKREEEDSPRSGPIEALRRRVSNLEADLEVHEHWFDRLYAYTKVLEELLLAMAGAPKTKTMRGNRRG